MFWSYKYTHTLHTHTLWPLSDFSVCILQLCMTDSLSPRIYRTKLCRQHLLSLHLVCILCVCYREMEWQVTFLKFYKHLIGKNHCFKVQWAALLYISRLKYNVVILFCYSLHITCRVTRVIQISRDSYLISIKFERDTVIKADKNPFGFLFRKEFMMSSFSGASFEWIWKNHTCGRILIDVFVWLHDQ